MMILARVLYWALQARISAFVIRSGTVGNTRVEEFLPGALGWMATTINTSTSSSTIVTCRLAGRPQCVVKTRSGNVAGVDRGTVVLPSS
eukprot:2701815-Rhodomonas_salina.2